MEQQQQQNVLTTSFAVEVSQERCALFTPRSNGRTKSVGNKKKSSVLKGPRTEQCVCLADGFSQKVPTAYEKQILHKAGLGFKKIKLDLNDDEQTVHGKLTSSDLFSDEHVGGFPQIVDCGGFDLMQCSQNSRDH